jgi:hypothetical protein
MSRCRAVLRFLELLSRRFQSSWTSFERFAELGTALALFARQVSPR